MRFLALSLSMLLILFAPARAASVLDRVKAAGTVSCGVLQEPEDYGKADVHGALSDLGSDLCHAVAAAVLGDASKVLFWSLPDEATGFSAVRDGKVDLLTGASPSPAMAIIYGLHFGSPVFFDSTGFIVNAASGIGSFADLAGRQVCMISNTPAENVFVSATASRSVKALPFPFEEEGEMNFGLVSGHCEAMVSSRSRLADARVGFGETRNQFVILPDHLSIDPMSPAVQDGDEPWAAIVDDVIGALVLAESGGVGRSNVASLRTTRDPILRQLSGLMPGIDEKVVDRDWAIRAIGAVGNYGEMYERDCGAGSPLKLPRGLNALWNQGGLMAATSIR